MRYQRLVFILYGFFCRRSDGQGLGVSVNRQLAPAVATHRVALRDGFRRRQTLLTDRATVRAALGKGAAGRQARQIRRRAGNAVQGITFLKPLFRPTAQQHLGIRMARVVAQDSRSSTHSSTNPPGVHHRHPVGDLHRGSRYRGSQTRSTARAAFAARAAGSGSGFAPWRRGRWSAHPPAAAAGYRRAQGRSSPAGAFRRTSRAGKHPAAARGWECAPGAGPPAPCPGPPGATALRGGATLQ